MAGKQAAEALAAKLMGREPSVEDFITKSVRVGDHPNKERNPGDGKQENLADDETDPLAMEWEREIHGNSEEGDDEDPSDDDENPDDDLTEDGDHDEGSGDDPEEEGSDEQDEGVSEAYYNDDDLIEVIVDGEAHEVTLSDLKRAYSGEGAIQKRLKEATLLKKDAMNASERLQRSYEEERSKFYQVAQQLVDFGIQPIIDPPDASLRVRDRDAYLLQKEAYDEDQKRIQDLKAGMGQALQTMAQQDQQNRERRQAYHSQQLVEKIPALRDPEKAKLVRKDILEVADHYGFSPEDVATVEHHGLIMMALDAARWNKMQKQRAEGKEVPTGRDKKAPRKLKPSSGGSVTQRKLAASLAGKQKRETEQKARRTGDPNDIAAMLVAKATTKGGRRGS